jgi:hypothetical protein
MISACTYYLIAKILANSKNNSLGPTLICFISLLIALAQDIAIIIKLIY